MTDMNINQPRFPTRVDLDPNQRETLVAALNRGLATAMDLHSQVKQAHWNIKGPQFFARHELFDRLATRMIQHADAYAERASTLGGYANGTVRMAGAASAIPEYDLRITDGRAHIAALADRYGTYAKFLRAGIESAGKIGDPATEDLFTGFLREAELDLWFLESHMMS